MEEYKVVLSQDLKDLEIKLNQYAQQGWHVLNIEHTVEYDSSTEGGDDLYPTDVKTVVTFIRDVSSEVK